MKYNFARCLKHLYSKMMTFLIDLLNYLPGKIGVVDMIVVLVSITPPVWQIKETGYLSIWSSEQVTSLQSYCFLEHSIKAQSSKLGSWLFGWFLVQLEKPKWSPLCAQTQLNWENKTKLKIHKIVCKYAATIILCYKNNKPTSNLHVATSQ